MSRRKISTTVYLTPDEDERLKRLSARTKVPAAAFIRQALDEYLDKHEPREIPQPITEADEGAQ